MSMKVVRRQPKRSKQHQQNKNSLNTGIKQINTPGLPGKFKAWIFKHGPPPKISVAPNAYKNQNPQLKVWNL